MLHRPGRGHLARAEAVAFGQPPGPLRIEERDLAVGSLNQRRIRRGASRGVGSSA